MQRRPRQRPQDEHVQCSRHQFRFLVHARNRTRPTYSLSMDRLSKDRNEAHRGFVPWKIKKARTFPHLSHQNFTCTVTALSLTTPAVSRDFILIFSVHEHTFPTARGSRLHGCLVSLVSPQLARAVFASSIRCGPPNISSVTIDHDELCDLPAGRRVA